MSRNCSRMLSDRPTTSKSEDLAAARLRMQEEMNCMSQAAELKRKEKERKKLEEKIKKYKKMGYLIDGETCAPSTPAKSKTQLDDGLVLARARMQDELNKKIKEPEERLKQKEEKERADAQKRADEDKKTQLEKLTLARQMMQEEIDRKLSEAKKNQEIERIIRLSLSKHIK